MTEPKSLGPICSTCGSANAGGDRFCPTCGSVLQDHGSSLDHDATAADADLMSHDDLPLLDVLLGTGRAERPGAPEPTLLPHLVPFAPATSLPFACYLAELFSRPGVFAGWPALGGATLQAVARRLAALERVPEKSGASSELTLARWFLPTDTTDAGGRAALLQRAEWLPLAADMAHPLTDADTAMRAADTLFRPGWRDEALLRVVLISHILPWGSKAKFAQPVNTAIDLLLEGEHYPPWLVALAISRLASAGVAGAGSRLAPLVARLADAWTPQVGDLLERPLGNAPFADVLRVHPGADRLAALDDAARDALGRELGPRVPELLNAIVHRWGGAPPRSARPKAKLKKKKRSVPKAGNEEIAKVAKVPRGQAATSTPLPAPAPGAECVEVAAFAPPRVVCGTSFLVQVLLFPPGAADEAEARALASDRTTGRRATYVLPIDLARGARVDVRLEMQGLVIDEPDAMVTWRGMIATVTFEVRVPEESTASTSIARVRLAVDGVPAGTMRFQVDVLPSGTAPSAAAPVELDARRYRKAFVSYASPDRGEVLKRVQAFRVLGLEVFQDILSLDPGDRWARELYRAIDDCDVFMLFWSSAAQASPWVDKEIDYALARKAGQEDHAPDIQPVPIEGPPIVPPPAKLGHLHFNDALLAHIRGATPAPSPPTAPHS